MPPGSRRGRSRSPPGAPRSRPPSSRTARSASGAARSSRCSASTTVVPRSALSRPTAANTSSAPCGSSCEVGSSSTSASGAAASAPAIAQRWRSPPDKRRRVAVAQVRDPERVEHLLDPSPHRLRRGARGSRARTRRRPRPGRRRTAPRGPGARSRRRPRAPGAGGCGSTDRTRRRRPRSGRRSSAGRARSRRAAACSCPSRTSRRRAGSRPARTSRSTAVERERPVRVAERHAGVGDRAHAPATGSGTSSGSGTKLAARRGCADGGRGTRVERDEQRDQRQRDERLEGRPVQRAGVPGERVLAREAEQPDQQRGGQHARDHEPVAPRPSGGAGSGGGPGCGPTRARRAATRNAMPATPEPDRRGPGAADERDERAREREQRAEPAPPGGLVPACCRFEPEAAGVHGLRERDRALHPALEHRHDAAQDAPATDRPPPGAGPVGLPNRDRPTRSSTARTRARPSSRRRARGTRAATTARARSARRSR